MPTRREGRPWPTDYRNEISDLVMDAQADLRDAYIRLRQLQQKLFSDPHSGLSETAVDPAA